MNDRGPVKDFPGFGRRYMTGIDGIARKSAEFRSPGRNVRVHSVESALPPELRMNTFLFEKSG